MYDSFPEALLAQPPGLLAWLAWLVTINVFGALVFIRRPESKWILLAMVGNGLVMEGLFQLFGYQRILGLAHVIFWTPLLAYLWRRRAEWDFSLLSGKWLAVLFTTNAISLLIDYTDVIRYLLGERI